MTVKNYAVIYKCEFVKKEANNPVKRHMSDIIEYSVNTRLVLSNYDRNNWTYCSHRQTLGQMCLVKTLSNVKVAFRTF